MSYCGLTDSRMSASEKDLPVEHNSNTYQHSLNTKSQYTDKKFRHNQICHENYLLSGICTFKAP
jgi:hypothetical protein